MSQQHCVLCGSTDVHPVLHTTVNQRNGSHGFRLMQCASCELVSTDLQLSENELQPYYAREYWGRTNADSQEWVLRDKRHRTRFFVSLSPPGPRAGCWMWLGRTPAGSRSRQLGPLRPRSHARTSKRQEGWKLSVSCVASSAAWCFPFPIWM